MAAVLQKPAYIGQFLTVIGVYAGRVGPTQPSSHGRYRHALYGGGGVEPDGDYGSRYCATLPASGDEPEEK